MYRNGNAHPDEIKSITKKDRINGTSKSSPKPVSGRSKPNTPQASNDQSGEVKINGIDALPFDSYSHDSSLSPCPRPALRPQHESDPFSSLDHRQVFLRF